MKLYAIICLIGISQLVLGQDNNTVKYPLSLADTYVLNVQLTGPVYNNKCPCGYKKDMKCFLFKMKEVKLLYRAVNIPLDSVALMKIGYIVIPAKLLDSIQIAKEIIVTATLSSSPKYLLFTRVLRNLPPEQYIQFYHPYAYLSDYIICKGRKKDAFEGFILEQN